MNSSFFCVIPANILYSSDLSEFQKLLYVAISGLTHEEGFCWASNDYFAKRFNKSKTWISLQIKKLKEGGLVDIEYIEEEGNRRLITLKEVFNSSNVCTKQKLKGSLTKVKEGSLTKVKHNNIYSNKINNISGEKKKKEKKHYSEDQKFIEFLNAYGRNGRNNNPEAYKKYLELKEKELLPEHNSLLEKAKDYNASLDPKENEKYKTGIQVWLNQERFNNDYKIFKEKNSEEQKSEVYNKYQKF